MNTPGQALRSALVLLAALCAPLGAAPASAQPRLSVTADIRLAHPDPRFGGYSGIEVSADGSRFVAISDRGTFLTGSLLRRDGDLVGVENLFVTPILDSRGQPLEGRNSDAEGLAMRPDGTLLVSFEGNHRIMRHASVTAAGEFLPRHPDFAVLQPNSGLEALALTADGTLLAIPERSGSLSRPFPVYALIGQDWQVIGGLSRQGSWLVAGADVFEEHLYIIERDFGFPAGFQSRIRRFALASLNTPSAQGEILFESRSGQFGNLEGISLHRGPDGLVRITLISDDNFLFLLPNQIVEMVIQPQ